MSLKCPICKKPSIQDFRPFCSKRCADVDLAHWFRGDYRIETDEEPKEGEREEQKEDND
jgi:uncharacterized protein